MGPFTPIESNILNGIRPKSYNDKIAMYHDIDYLSNEEPIMSDLKAIALSDNSIEGNTMKLGLTARSILDAYYHINPWSYIFTNPTHINGSEGTDQEIRTKQDQLRKIASNF